MTLDGKERFEEIPTRNLAICNGRFFGSGMEVAPWRSSTTASSVIADPGAAPKLKFALASSRIYEGKHLGDSPDVHHYRCNSVKPELLNRNVEKTFLLDVDGETLGVLPIEVKLERDASRCSRSLEPRGCGVGVCPLEPSSFSSFVVRRTRALSRNLPLLGEHDGPRSFPVWRLFSLHSSERTRHPFETVKHLLLCFIRRLGARARVRRVQRRGRRQVVLGT